MKVNGDLNLNNSSIESLGNLKKVKGDLYLMESSIESLGELEEVQGSLNLNKVEQLKNKDGVYFKINLK